jgi:hypothetical protein
MFGRSTLVLLIALQVAHSLSAPPLVVDALVVLTCFRLLTLLPPAGLASTVRTSLAAPLRGER